MDFTDFVEPCSLEFLHFHTFSIFVLAKIFITNGKDGFTHAFLSITETSFKEGPLKKSLRNTIISCISLPGSLLNGDTKCITSFRSFLWIIVWEKVPGATWSEWQFWLHCLSVRGNKSENRSNDPIIIVLHRKGSGFFLRFLLGSTIIIEQLYCLRWSCPLNYTRASLLSCASNRDSYFKKTCKKRNALSGAHLIVT